MYNVQVHFSGRFSFINVNFQSTKGDNPKRFPPGHNDIIHKLIISSIQIYYENHRMYHQGNQFDLF